MNFDPSRIAGTLNALWESHGGWIVALAAVAALALSGLAAWVLWRRANTKKILGFGIVQAGVTYAVLTGVYEFFHRVLGMPTIEAIVLAIFIEGAVWGAVGFIVAHGRVRDSVGFGDAGPFFWFATIAGGTLAVIGSQSAAVAIGRVMIVALGAYMWYLQLLGQTRRSRRRSSWRWTPRRLLLALGAMAPEDADVADEAQEWQVRRLARALRWSNASWPWKPVGRWMLTRRAETTTETVLSEARRRWAAAHLLREQSRADSPVMAAVLAEVERAARQVDSGWTTIPAQGWTTPALSGGQPPVNGVDMSAFVRAVNGRPADGGHVQSSAAVDSAVLSTEQERLMSTLAAVDSDGRWRYPTHKDLARRLRTSPKTVSRRLSDLRALYGVKTDGQLRDIATGQNPPARVDNQVDNPTSPRVDTTGGHDRTAEVDNRPDTQVDITAGGDRS